MSPFRADSAKGGGKSSGHDLGIAASSGWAGARRLCYEWRPMPLHLIKLAVGAESLADLREWMVERMAEAKRRRAPLRHAHITRMTPKRVEEILDGGSLYWVVKGLISARQQIVGLEPFVDADGIGRCKIWLDQTVVAVAPRPMRAFQGWRYYEAKNAPPDIDEAQPGFAAMPEALRRELAGLGLL
jgi:hypothetical protein